MNCTAFLKCAIPLIYTFFQLFTAVTAYTQDPADELQEKLRKAKEDTAKINLLNQLSWEMSYTNAGIAKEYARQALILSEKTGYHEGAGEAAFNLGILYYISGNFDSSMFYLDESLDIKSAINDNKGRASVLTNMGLVYVEMGKYDEARRSFSRSIQILEVIRNIKGVAYNTMYMGNIELRKADYSRAEEHYSRARQIFIDINDSSGMASAITNQGQVAVELANYVGALEHFQEALNIYTLLDEKDGIATCLNNIGSVHSYQSADSLALEYYFQTLSVYEEIGDVQGVATSLQNTGMSYGQLKNYNAAIENYKSALGMFQNSGDKHSEAFTLSNMGGLYYDQKKHDQALDYFNQSLELSQQIGDKHLTGINMGYTGSVYLELGNYSSAIDFSRRCMQIAREVGAKNTLAMAYSNLSSSFAALKDYKRAYDYHSLLKAINDSIYNEENSRQLHQMEQYFQNVKKQRQIDQQKALLLAKDLELQRERIFRNSLIGGVILFIIIVILILYAYILKRRDNVKISQQKKQIEEQRDEIQKQHQMVVKQNDLLAEQKKAITDSINYASRIQHALLPPSDLFKHLLPQHFVLNMPRDIVSGDFYWIEKHKNKILFCVADCTGHGVPGAFMSMLGMTLLNEIVGQMQDFTAAELLDSTRERVIAALRQTGDQDETKDGMDMVFCILDPETKKLQMAGANNPVFHVRKGKLNEIPGDRMPIGIHLKASQRFTNHEIQLEKGDSLYLFSDGYIDQFGGDEGKKLKSNPFKEVILNIQENIMHEQKRILETTFMNWKGDREQVDDVLVIGIRI